MTLYSSYLHLKEELEEAKKTLDMAEARYNAVMDWSDEAPEELWEVAKDYITAVHNIAYMEKRTREDIVACLEEAAELTYKLDETLSALGAFKEEAGHPLMQTYRYKHNRDKHWGYGG